MSYRARSAGIATAAVVPAGAGLVQVVAAGPAMAPPPGQLWLGRHRGQRGLRHLHRHLRHRIPRHPQVHSPRGRLHELRALGEARPGLRGRVQRHGRARASRGNRRRPVPCRTLEITSVRSWNNGLPAPGPTAGSAAGAVISAARKMAETSRRITWACDRGKAAPPGPGPRCGADIRGLACDVRHSPGFLKKSMVPALTCTAPCWYSHALVEQTSAQTAA